MAIQTHNVNQENLWLPMSPPDYFFTENRNLNDNTFFDEYGYNYDNQQEKLLQQQQQYMAHLHNMKRRNFSMGENNNFVFLQPSKKQKVATNPGKTASTITSESVDNNLLGIFSGQLEKQRNEIDRFVNLQNEWLKLALHEQRKQQLGAIINKLELKSQQLLKQKDNEIIEATKKTMELQEIVRKLEIDNQSWQRIALENQSIVFSLNSTIQQLQQQQQQVCCSSSNSNIDADAESCCNGEIGENRGVFGLKNREITKSTTKTTIGICKVCNSRNGVVLILPCRHLGCCKECEALVDACPVCKSPKMGSIDVVL